MPRSAATWLRTEVRWSGLGWTAYLAFMFSVGVGIAWVIWNWTGK